MAEERIVQAWDVKEVNSECNEDSTDSRHGKHLATADGSASAHLEGDPTSSDHSTNSHHEEHLAASGGSDSAHLEGDLTFRDNFTNSHREKSFAAISSSTRAHLEGDPTFSDYSANYHHEEHLAANDGFASGHLKGDPTFSDNSTDSHQKKHLAANDGSASGHLKGDPTFSDHSTNSHRELLDYDKIKSSQSICDSHESPFLTDSNNSNNVCKSIDSTGVSVSDACQAANLITSLDEVMGRCPSCQGMSESFDNSDQCCSCLGCGKLVEYSSPPATIKLFRFHPFEDESSSHGTCSPGEKSLAPHDKLEVAEPILRTGSHTNRMINEVDDTHQLADKTRITDNCKSLCSEEPHLEANLLAIEKLNKEVDSLGSSMALLDANLAHCQIESFLLDELEMQTKAFGDGERYIMYPDLNNPPEVEEAQGDHDETLLEKYILEFVETRNQILSENRSRWGEELERVQDLDDYSVIDILPDEILLRILSYMPLRYNMTVTALVCKRWYILSADPSLWQHINVPSESGIDPHWLGFLASKAPQLKSIAVRGGRNISRDVLSVIARFCPLLNVVDFGFCNITVQMLDILVENCPSIHTANFEGCECVSFSWIKALCKLQKLRNINISHCNHLSDDDIVYMAEHMTSLADVSIDGNSFLSDQCVQALCNKHRESLVKLSIDGAESTDASIEHALSCPNLTLFTVSFADNLTNRSIDYFLNGRAMTHLQIRKNKIIDINRMQSLFVSTSMQHLIHLDLTECLSVTDPVVEAICKCCPRLVALILQWCWSITDVGVEHIVNTFCNLQHLDLLGLDTIQGGSFDKLPQKLPRLVYLNLAQCNRIDDDLLVRVLARMPQLTAINFYHENFRNAT